MYKLLFKKITIKFSFPFFLLISAGVISCTSVRKSSSIRDDQKINVTFVQINDVYEIAPLDSGRSGGMARVATIKKQYLTSNPNTYLVMAGDFLSPSVYNSLQYQGRRIRGKQMIESMNAAGMNIAIFGNHEFDISESELQQRLNESQFNWISSNTFNSNGNDVLPFIKTSSAGSQPLPETYIMTVTDADGTSAKIGFIGLTIPFNKASYVTYKDPLMVAETLYNRIKDSCDAVIAITHQLVADDSILAERLPGLAVILGGHEHDMRFKKIGNVYITKAHANARSAYIVNLMIDKRNHSINVKPELKMIDESIAVDSATNVVVKNWMDIADSNYSSLGFDAKKIILKSGEPLDGRETSIRTSTTNFSRIIIDAMQEAIPTADVVIMNAGSIRVDDMVSVPVTEYDIIRSLPFGGAILEVDMKGSLLVKILETGVKNKGIGGYLHYSNAVTFDEDKKVWSLNNAPLDTGIIYKVGITEFLMTGGEANMDFLKKDNPDIIKVYPAVTDVNDSRSDIRLAIIRYMQKMP